MNTIPAARSDVGAYDLHGGVFCHVTTSSPENVVQDHGKVYDVAHHASNILLAGMQDVSEQQVGDASKCSLPCSDIHCKPNLRTRLQIHSSHYWQFNLLDTIYFCVIHLP